MKKTIEVLERLKKEGKLWDRSNVKALTHAIAVLKRCEDEKGLAKELYKLFGNEKDLYYFEEWARKVQAISKHLKEGKHEE